MDVKGTMAMQTLRQTMTTLLRRAYGDTRGTSTLTTAVTLPLLIVLLFGIFGLYRMMSVKWVFDRGTREAARYISEEARFWDLSPASGTAISETLPANYYDIEAKRIILSRLADVMSEKSVYDIITHTLKVTVTEPILAEVPGATPDPNFVQVGSYEELCDPPRVYKSTEPGTFRHPNNIRFRISAELEIPIAWMPRLPFTDPITPSLKFRQRAVGYVQCARWTGQREANDPQLDKIERYSREGPAIPYRYLATPWFPTVTPAPTSTPAPPTASPTPP